MSDKYDDLLEIARQRFKLASEAEAHQREQEQEDLRFQVPELQWTDAAKAQRTGDGKLPGRPILSVTQIDAPIRLTRNQARAAKLGVNIHPISEAANDETAEAYQGLYRRIERDSNATTARMWAFDRALKCGRGIYKIVTRYDEDSPETFDQEIGIQRILHQGSVYLDPAATEPDWSDGKWAFEVTWLPLADFQRQYPDADAARVTGRAEWEAIGNTAPEWVRGGYEKDAAVQVAQYWFKETKLVKVEVPGRAPREREEVTVYSCHITGAEVIQEPELWNGRHIPYVVVLGDELQPFDERRRFAGMVTNAKDAQRGFNFAVSNMVESLALEPKAPWVAPEGSLEGYEEDWKQSNVRNFPVLFYKPTSLDGKPVGPPERAQVDGTRMSLSSMAMNEFRGMVQQTTAVHEASLGKTDKDVRSGRALLALQSQADMANGDYISNLAEVAMAHEARMILDLMPKIYDRPGRVTRILRGDDQKAEAVVLNAPFVVKDGRPQQVPKGTQGAKAYNLSEGRYGVSVDVGRSYRTRLQEGDESLSRLIEARPDLMDIIGDILFTFKDIPGAKEIAKRLSKVRELKYPNIGEGEDGQPTPEQAVAKAQMMEQQVQQLTQHLQAAGMALQTDQAKQQAQMAKAQMDAQASMAKAQLDQQTALAKTKMETESREAQVAAQEETKRLIAGLQAEVEAVKELVKTQQAAMAQQSEGMARREGMAHEVMMGELGRDAPEEPEAQEGAVE